MMNSADRFYILMCAMMVIGSLAPTWERALMALGVMLVCGGIFLKLHKSKG